MRNRTDLYADVTRAIMGALDTADPATWKPCWTGLRRRPVNAQTGRRYSGVNVLLLWAAAQEKGYADHRWATLRQLNAMGHRIRQGERSELALFFKQLVREKDGEKQVIRVARAYRVFNVEQTEGYIPPAPPPQLTEYQRHGAAEAVIRKTGAQIMHNEASQPCYVPTLDVIRMPLFERFVNPTGFYGTLFHELGHWTGHKSRLDRQITNRFGSHGYALEELVAELTSAFVCADLDIEISVKDEHAAYIRSWLEVAKADKTAIPAAAAAAQAAADFILNSSTVEADAELEGEAACA